MFYNQQYWFMFIYICIPVYCLYIVYKYLGMTPSGTTVVLLLFFIFLVLPCFILLLVLVICAFFHTCMFLVELSLLINKEFEFEFVYIYTALTVWQRKGQSTSFCSQKYSTHFCVLTYTYQIFLHLILTNLCKLFPCDQWHV
jgi:hypothetical protein